MQFLAILSGARAPPTSTRDQRAMSADGMRSNTVGTTDTIVAPASRAVANDSPVAFGEIRGTVPKRAPRVRTENPPMWFRGIHANHVSAAVWPKRAADRLAAAASASCVNTTAFGAPVDPDVHMINASPSSVAVPPDTARTVVPLAIAVGAMASRSWFR